MSAKFKNVPVDTDTIIITQQEIQIGDFEVLYQKWFWDGITAESVIFADDDVETLGDEEIEHEVKLSSLLKQDSAITIKRTDSGFIFVNFNFESE